jgi:hypothetical protein
MLKVFAFVWLAASPAAALDACVGGCPALAQLNSSASLSESGARSRTAGGAKGFGSAAMGEGRTGADADGSSFESGAHPEVQENLPADDSARKPKTPPPPQAEPKKAGGPPAWLTYSGAAVLGALGGLGHGLLGMAAGAGIGLVGAYLFRKKDYGGAFGVMAGSLIGSFLGGPIGGLLGGLIGGLIGHFAQKLIQKKG